jgi:hypothetical protein
MNNMTTPLEDENDYEKRVKKTHILGETMLRWVSLGFNGHAE